MANRSPQTPGCQCQYNKSDNQIRFHGLTLSLLLLLAHPTFSPPHQYQTAQRQKQECCRFSDNRAVYISPELTR